MVVTIFANVSYHGAKALMLSVQQHMRYKMWTEPDGDDSVKILCDKSQPLLASGREASGDARGAGLRVQARAATRGSGSNPERSTTMSFFSRRR